MCSAALSTTVCDMAPSFVFCEPVLKRTLFPDGFFSPADPFLNFASFLFRLPRDFQVGVVRRLSDLLLNFPLHFVELAFGLVFRAWFHDFLPSSCNRLRLCLYSGARA